MRLHNIIQAAGSVQVGLVDSGQVAAHRLVVHHDVQHARLAFDDLVARLLCGRLDVGHKSFQIK